MKTPNFAELKPWAGLVAGMGSGRACSTSSSSDSMHFDCRYGEHDLLVAAGALLLIAIGALRVVVGGARASATPDSTRRFVAHLSLMSSAFFALIVLWGAMAGVILPACLP